MSYYYSNSTDQGDEISSPKLAQVSMIKDVDLHSSDGLVERTVLPAKKNSDVSYYYTFKVRKEANGDAQYINVNNFYSSFSLYCEGKKIYENPCVENTEDASFDLIRLDENYYDKELKIEFKTNLDSDRDMMIPSIMTGSKIAILSYHIDEALIKNYSAVFLFITSVFLFILAIVFYKIKSSAINIILVALFSLKLSLYISVRSWIIHYYLNNSILINYIEYVSLMTMPLPIFLLFINVFYENKYYTWRIKVFKYSSLLVLVNLMVQIFLVVSEKSKFILMQSTTFFLLIYCGFCIPIVLLTVNKKALKYKTYHILSILPFCILVILALINYFYTFHVAYVPFMLFSTICFLFVHIILATKKYIDYLNVSIKKDFYENLAYVDVLSGLRNRHAFDLKVQSIASKKELFNTMYVFMIDMNKLKYVNDTYGHYAGDEYIKEIGRILLTLEKKEHNVDAYRYAGDEFIVIAYDKNKKDVNQIISFINKNAARFMAEACNYRLSVAIGYAYVNKKNYKQDSFDMRELIKIADKYMYINKAKDRG